jgi:hypothetical protein
MAISHREAVLACKSAIPVHDKGDMARRSAKTEESYWNVVHCERMILGNAQKICGTVLISQDKGLIRHF